MKKFFASVLMIAAALPLLAQRGNVTTDFFGDLRYEAHDPGYTAALKKDIFDNLTFTDSRDNKIVFEKRYLDKKHPGMAGNKVAKTDFFRSLVRNCREDSRYEARYKIDIFDKDIFEDNRGNRTSAGRDIFGNITYEERGGGRDMSVRKDIHGALQYRSGSETASLDKDIFGKWSYRDSTGNRFEFSNATWNRLMRRFGSDEEVFWFLLDSFMRDKL